MISKLGIYSSSSTSPYLNLAMEKTLFDQVDSGELILFLWTNQPSVVIGRNQNPYKECNLSIMESDDVKLVRRLSGGGAVYHDLKNLNFTFISRDEDMKITRNLGVIQKACSSFGLDAEISGRNDLTIDGFKFSGNAFLHSGGHAYHHGTIMIGVDSGRLSSYLNVDSKKLSSKGLDSVRSRVINLSSLNSSINVENMKTALKAAFEMEFQLKSACDQIIDNNSFSTLQEKVSFFQSAEWIMGKKANCSYHIRERFSWGDFDLNFDIADGLLTNVQLFSDALDQDFIVLVSKALANCPAKYSSIEDAINRLIQNQLNQQIKIATDSVIKSMANDILSILKLNL